MQRQADKILTATVEHLIENRQENGLDIRQAVACFLIHQFKGASSDFWKYYALGRQQTLETDRNETWHNTNHRCLHWASRPEFNKFEPTTEQERTERWLKGKGYKAGFENYSVPDAIIILQDMLIDMAMPEPVEPVAVAPVEQNPVEILSSKGPVKYRKFWMGYQDGMAGVVIRVKTDWTTKKAPDVDQEAHYDEIIAYAGYEAGRDLLTLSDASQALFDLHVRITKNRAGIAAGSQSSILKANAAKINAIKNPAQKAAAIKELKKKR